MAMEHLLMIFTAGIGAWAAWQLLQVRRLGRRMQKQAVHVNGKEQQHPLKG